MDAVDDELECAERKLHVTNYFYGDVVSRSGLNGGLDFGVVVSTYDNTSSDDEDLADSSSRVRPGYAEISWCLEGSTEVVEENTLILVDRSFFPRCPVSLKSASHKRGYVNDSSFTMSLKLAGSDKVIENVAVSDVEQLCTFKEGVEFLYKEGWVGCIETPRFTVILRCRDGSVISVSDKELVSFKEVIDERSLKSKYEKNVPFIGQHFWAKRKELERVVFVKQTQAMKSWLVSKSQRNRRTLLTVQQVKVSSVDVKWLFCISQNEAKVSMQGAVNEIVNSRDRLENIVTKHSTPVVPPASAIVGEDIKFIRPLNYFDASKFEVGHRFYYSPNEIDNECSSGSHSKISPGMLQSVAMHEDNHDVDWTDVECDNDDKASHALGKSSSQRKRRKTAISAKRLKNPLFRNIKKHEISSCYTNEIIPNAKDIYVLISTETMCTVVWQDGSEESNVLARSLFPEYDMDADFMPGGSVKEDKNQLNLSEYGIIQKSCLARIALVKWFKLSSHKREPEFIREEEVSFYDLRHSEHDFYPGFGVIRIPEKESAEDDPASRVGQVIELMTSGQILCRWLNGSKSLEYPHELYNIGMYDEAYDTESDDKCALQDSQKKSQLLEAVKLKLSSSRTTGITEAVIEIISQFEAWFAQHSNLNETNGLPVIQEMLSLCKELSNMDVSLNPTVAPSGSLQNQDQVPTSAKEDESISPPVVLVRECLDLISQLKSCVMNDSFKTDAQALEVIPPLLSEVQIAEEIETGDHNADMRKFLVEEECTEVPGALVILGSVPDSHKFKSCLHQPTNIPQFLATIRREISILKTSLPVDILVKTFEDRMDLFSFMIKGPKSTPYEDGLFIFDVQLPSMYPSVPPAVHFLSFCSDRLNPNLYESGKVCVSLLGTWSGKGSEVWSSQRSNLLQLMVSVQGLILVEEPYFNEAGYSKERETAVDHEQSRSYNEMAVLKLIQYMTKMVLYPPEVFKDEILTHVKRTSGRLISRMEKWIELSEKSDSSGIVQPLNLADNSSEVPTFPLLPVSRGFCLSMKKALSSFRETLCTVNNDRVNLLFLKWNKPS
ncbi:(E3-independent) E2 ubiquitin-conjugating enzyme UBE2O [Halotydeus destructor]|nr:(E3-independent) E2 ubiquitin-conjugating enzyme UBE2O [Halotydeus destructor]